MQINGSFFNAVIEPEPVSTAAQLKVNAEVALIVISNSRVYKPD